MCPRCCAAFADSSQVSSCDYCYLFFFFSTLAKNYLALRSLKSKAILKISCVSKYTYLYLMQVDTALSLETSEGTVCSGHLYMAAHGYVPSEPPCSPSHPAPNACSTLVSYGDPKLFSDVLVCAGTHPVRLHWGGVLLQFLPAGRLQVKLVNCCSKTPQK